MTKILLADDSVTIQKVVELTFSDESSQVTSVSDGNAALEKLQSERPDIIISDVIMPGMSGYELCQRIKTDPGLQTIPFLFLKGTFESFDEEKAKQCGADGVIVKPFESQELIQKVRELVALGGAPSAEAAATPPEPEPVTADVPEVPAVAPSPPAVEAPAAVPPPPPAPPAPEAPAVAVPPPPVATPVPEAPAAAVPPPPVAPPMPEAPAAAVPPPSVPEAPAAPPLPEAPPALPPEDEETFDLGPEMGVEDIDEVSESPVPSGDGGGFFEEGGAVESPPSEVEKEEDLWSEVSLRGGAAPLIEDKELEEESFWGAQGAGEGTPAPAGDVPPSGEELLEEVGEPDILDLTEEAETTALEESSLVEEASPFELEEEIAPIEEAALVEPPPGAEPVFETPAPAPAPEIPSEPLPAAEPEFSPPEPEVESTVPPPDALFESPAEPPPSADTADQEALVGTRLEEAVRNYLGPVIGEAAQKIIEEVVWEVIPDLAEAMIRSEIEKIKKAGGEGGA